MLSLKIKKTVETQNRDKISLGKSHPGNEMTTWNHRVSAGNVLLQHLVFLRQASRTFWNLFWWSYNYICLQMAACCRICDQTNSSLKQSVMKSKYCLCSLILRLQESDTVYPLAAGINRWYDTIVKLCQHHQNLNERNAGT